MKLFRVRYVIHAFTIFTGIVFLNMSFVLAEVSALKLDRDNQLAKTISILIAGSAAEEEPGGSADDDSNIAEIDLLFNHPTNPAGSFSFSFKNKVITSQGVPRLGNYEIYSPPPEA